MINTRASFKIKNHLELLLKIIVHFGFINPLWNELKAERVKDYKDMET